MILQKSPCNSPHIKKSPLKNPYINDNSPHIEKSPSKKSLYCQCRTSTRILQEPLFLPTLKNPYLKNPYINDNSSHIEKSLFKKSPHKPMFKPVLRGFSLVFQRELKKCLKYSTVIVNCAKCCCLSYRRKV
jgi:hypothetical protein